MEANLTAGAIEKILKVEVKSHTDMVLTLQVTDLKPVHSAKDPNLDRFRLSLSDGIHLQQGMLGTNLNDLVKNGNLLVGSIVRLTSFTCSLIRDRMIVIIQDLEVIRTNSDIIGRPVQMRNSEQRVVVDSGVNSSTNGGVEPSGGRRTTGFEQQGRVEPSSVRPNQAAVLPQAGQQRQVLGANSGTSVPGAAAASARTYANPSVGNGVPSSTPAYGNPSVANGAPKQEHGRGPPGTGVPGSAAASARAYSNPSVGNGVPRQPASANQQRQPPPMYGNSGPVGRNEAPPRILPINALTPYMGKWTIKARVTGKSELKRFNNQRGEGKVFSFDLLDSYGGEIRATCFNAVAEQFFNVIVIGNLYVVSRGTLKPAQKKFNHLKHEYEITLDNASTIQQCYEEDPAIPRQQFHFRSIGDIEGMNTNSIIDVIGIVSSISPTGTIMRKDGVEVAKRALQLKDMSGRSVELTMWGNFCNSEGQELQNLCDSGRFPVLALKAGKIGEFNGKNLGTIGTSQLFVDPDFPEAQKLKEWFEREGRNAPFTSISKEFIGSGRVDIRKTVSQIKDENLGTSEKPDWITISATISFIKTDNFCYTGCPNKSGDRPCSKKVIDNGDGTWRCEKCERTFEECDYRYILQFQIQDHTGITWVTAFQEAGEEIMGMPAKKLYSIQNEENDDDKFLELISRVLLKRYIFKLKVKEETFNDETRVKVNVVKVDKLDYSSDTKTVLDAMNKLRTGDAGVKPEGSHYSSDAVNTGTGSSGIRDPSSSGLPANQSGQYGNQYSNGSRPAPVGTTSCNLCGNSSHDSANCPSVMSAPQGQYVAGSYRSTSGSFAG